MRLSPFERGMYYEQKLNPDSTEYNMDLIFCIKGAGRGQTEQAFSKLFGNHEAFRSYFYEGNGEVFRGISKELPVIEWRDDQGGSELNRAFDLSGVPVKLYGCEREDEITVRMLIHHIIFDANSEKAVTDELFDHLRGREVKVTSDISDADRSFDDDFFSRGEAFYKELFSDDLPDVLMPVKGPRPGVMPVTDSEQSIFFDRDEYTGLHDLAKDLDVSVYAFMVGVLSMALSRYTGSEDLLLGIPANMRPPEFKDVIGMFVNSAVIRVKPVHDKLLPDYLKEVKEVIKSAAKESPYSYSLLCEKYAGKDPGRNALFDVSINDVRHVDTLNDGNLSLDLSDVPQNLKRDMDILLQRKDDTLRILLKYPSQLYDDALISNFLEQVSLILENIRKSPKENIGSLCVLPESHIKKIEELSTSSVKDVPVKLLHELFEKSAGQNHDKPALIASDRTMSYEELNREANGAARTLLSNGTATGDRILILMQRRSIFFTALFGILKAGAAFIPCDPAYPDERIRQIAMDSGASMILTSTDRAASLLDGWDYAGKVLTDDKLISDGPCDSAPEVSVNPEDLAYLIYTSGSTGKPKGVELTHAGICNYLDPDPANIHVHILATKTRTTLSVTTVSFDMSFKETLTTLCNGKTLVFADEDQANDPAALTALFEKTGADCFNATPSRLQQYMEYEPFTAALSGCRLIMAGGEQYPLSLLKKLKGLAKEGTKIVNTYGPTEITVSCNGALLNGADKVTVGRPLLNVKEYIMDASGHLMPPYCTGELYIGGRGVARGYRNLPEATKKSFVEFNGERFYRSGDLARWDEKGNMVILGRIDSQIKLRGLRIELGEIEGAIEDYSGIKKAVAAVKKLAGQDQLCAYYISDGQIDIKDLKEHLKNRLTFYMIPVSFMRLTEIPVTHNGKTDVKALPDPVIKAEDHRKPETGEQELIYDLIKEVTGIDGFGIDTDFEEIGLSSLTMVGLTLKMSSLFGKPLKFSDIKDNPTVEKLAAHINNIQKNEDYGLKKIYPLTMTQTGIYVECMANPGTTIYNIPLLYELTPDIDLVCLKEAIITAVDAHPFLKGRIMEGEDGVYVKRQDDRVLPVEISKIEGAADFASIVRPYDLLKDDLARFRILIYPDKKYLYMDLHHIAADGQSRKILERDISRAYLKEKIDKEEYTGFEVALSEEKDRKGPAYNKAKDHYEKLLKDADQETVPPCMPQGKEQKSLHLSRLSDLALDGIEGFCKAHHTTANGFFNAVFGYVLSVFSYSEEAVFTTVYNGRNDARMTDTVTMLVKTLPVRVCINNDISPARFVKKTGDELLSCMENDIFSFGEISRAYGIKGRVRVIYQGPAPGGGDGEWEEDTFCGQRIRRRHLKLDTPKSDLTVEIFARESGIEFIAEYDSSRYCSEWAGSFLAAMDKVSREFLNRDRLSDVELMYEGGPDYYARSNDTDYKVEYVSVNRLFEAQAAKHPDKTAVVAAGESLTFSDLNRYANRVAHALIKMGVKKDSIVGMVFDRRKELFIAEQGILKAGGAFLPMVEEYPDDRIEYCLRDANSTIVLTSKYLLDERGDLFSEDKPYRSLAIEDLITQEDNDDNPDINIDPDALAYCIYTSGSTGRPKGVMLEQRNMCNYLNANIKHPTIYWLTVDISAALSVTSISFDMSINERFVTLCNGITIVMATLDEIHDPIALAKLMNEYKVESMVCTPSYLMSLLELEDTHGAIARLKALHVGGEAFPASLADIMKRLNPDSHLMNGYGPTETSVSSNSYDVVPGKSIVIGKPEANHKEYVFDRNGRLLPFAAMGELIICGAGVGRGYVGLPEKTAASFFTYQGLRAYHSGDLVRMNPKGEYEYYGRIDNQVKLRGLRIELDEVENVTLTFPGMELSKVIVRNNGREDYLAGFYTAKSRVDEKELKDFLRTKLTPYMVPDVLMQLDEMPLTVNGKIDKKKLPETESGFKEREFAEPENDIERMLCKRIGEILKLDRVGATDDFFSIGGTSLSAALLVSFAMKQGYDVVYKNVFDHPTARKLAAFISGRIKKEDKAGSEDSDVDSGERDTYVEKHAAVLKYNVNRELNDISTSLPENVMLTGVTGFLGIHVLCELLKHPEIKKVYCLVRDKGIITGEHRLLSLFVYYGLAADDGLDPRITIIKGDVTDDDLKDRLKGIKIDRIINCAALVKHFEEGNMIRHVNYDGLINLIDLAIHKDSALIQISTLSIAGTVEKNRRTVPVLKENTCDLLQKEGTKYSTSKFDAEQALLEAVETRGLKGKIIRVGNLMGREKDGEFQVNFRTNGFITRLKAYSKIGCFPVDNMDSPVDFSPVDRTAEAIVLLSGTPDKFTVFHANNCHGVHMANVLQAMAECGYPVEVVTLGEFNDKLSEALDDEEKSITVSSILSYNGNADEDRLRVRTDNEFTVKALYRLGFSWPITGLPYISRMLEMLKEMGFFN